MTWSRKFAPNEGTPTVGMYVQTYAAPLPHTTEGGLTFMGRVIYESAIGAVLDPPIPPECNGWYCFWWRFRTSPAFEQLKRIAKNPKRVIKQSECAISKRSIDRCPVMWYSSDTTSIRRTTWDT